MYQPKRFAISLSAISLYPSAISLSVDVRSQRRDRTAVPPARGAAVCRGSPHSVQSLWGNYLSSGKVPLGQKSAPHSVQSLWGKYNEDTDSYRRMGIAGAVHNEYDAATLYTHHTGRELALHTSPTSPDRHCSTSRYATSS